MTPNGDKPWPSLDEARQRVLCIQRKLHLWAKGDESKRFDDLFNLVCDRGTLVVAWDRVRSNRGARTAGVDGTVTLVGTMMGERERDLARRTIAAVDGVRDIDDLTTLSRTQKAADRRARQRAEIAVQSLLDENDRLRISVFGHVGLISGRVNSLEKRDAVERAIVQATPVSRVINELTTRYESVV